MTLVEAQLGRKLSDFEGMDAPTLLEETVLGRAFGRAALVSSFGTESAVLLHMISRIDPSFPVLFLDTLKLFGETLDYNKKLAAEFGLNAISHLEPDSSDIAELDPRGTLWRDDPDSCCGFRKTKPLDAALTGFDAWITGRKRYQGSTRESLPAVEMADGQIKINPLAHWDKSDIEAYFVVNELPRHPLESRGFPSIGCLPCTAQVAPGEDMRAGRWRGKEKTECGIHLSAGATSPRLPRK